MYSAISLVSARDYLYALSVFYDLCIASSITGVSNKVGKKKQLCIFLIWIFCSIIFTQRRLKLLKAEIITFATGITCSAFYTQNNFFWIVHYFYQLYYLNYFFLTHDFNCLTTIIYVNSILKIVYGLMILNIKRSIPHSLYIVIYNHFHKISINKCPILKQ